MDSKATSSQPSTQLCLSTLSRRWSAFGWVIFSLYRYYSWFNKCLLALLLCCLSFYLGCSQEEANNQPVIDRFIVPTEVSVGARADLHIIARDLEGDPLTYAWSATGGQMENAVSRTVSWTAPDKAGPFTVTVYISDGVSAPIARTKQIQVKAPNVPPEITDLVLPQNIVATEVVKLFVVATDPDNDTLTYAWAVDGETISGASKAKIDWEVPTELGQVTIQVTVSDQINPPVQSSKTVTIVRASTIAPGQKADAITLGDPFQKTQQTYGQPSIFEQVDDLIFFAFWNPDLGVSGFIDGEEKTVVAAFIQAPNTAKTGAGNGVNSPLVSVEEEFGPVEDIRDNLEHWYWTRGIEFDIRDQHVEQIFVFRPVLERLLAAPAVKAHNTDGTGRRSSASPPISDQVEDILYYKRIRGNYRR